MNRRKFLGTSAGASMALSACGKTSNLTTQDLQLDFSKPEDNLYGLMKLMGDISGARTYYFQPGRVFAHQDGKLPTLLLNYAGATIREIQKISDSEYVTQYSGWQLFYNPATNAVADRWTNPLTATQHTVKHFAFPNRKQTFTANGFKRPEGYTGEFNRFDKPFILPWQRLEDRVWAPYEQFSRYTNKEGHERYENAIHTYEGKIAELVNPKLTSAPSTIASQSQSPYYPWMGFENSAGHMISTSLGKKSTKLSLYPDDFLKDLKALYPDALNAVFDWT